MPTLSFDFTILISMILVASFFLVACFVLYLLKEVQRQPEITSGYHLLHQAQRQAQALLSKAEIESIKITADSKVATRQFEEKLQTNLSEETQQAEKDLAKSLKNIEKSTQGRVDEFFLHFEKEMASFLAARQEASVQNIEAEIKAAKEAVENYKNAQFALIEENLAATLERALSLVISKRLSLKEHLELVEEALEQAKKEKFIV